MTEAVRWSAYPSWAQFIWLYLFIALACVRAGLAWRLGIPGWSGWLIGAALLVICVAILRHWARYVLTSDRVVIRNGLTGRDIDAVAFADITDASVHQGPIARLSGIGTVYVRAADGRLLRFRGVRDPDAVKTRLDALRRAA